MRFGHPLPALAMCAAWERGGVRLSGSGDYCIYHIPLHPMGIRKWLTPKWVDRYTDVYRKEGFKGVVKKGGWKLVIIFFLFYLIRDSVIYLLLPFLAAK